MLDRRYWHFNNNFCDALRINVAYWPFSRSNIIMWNVLNLHDFFRNLAVTVVNGRRLGSVQTTGTSNMQDSKVLRLYSCQIWNIWNSKVLKLLSWKIQKLWDLKSHVARLESGLKDVSWEFLRPRRCETKSCKQTLICYLNIFFE